MKKQFFGLLALILCACSGLTACSDDDDDDNSTNDKLIGRWMQTDFKEWDEDDRVSIDDMDWETDPDEMNGTEFTSDGKMHIYEIVSGNWKNIGTANYKVNGNKITATSGNTTEVFTVLELSDDILILEEEGIDEGQRYIVRSRFRRVS